MDPTIWVLAAIAFVPAIAFMFWVRAREQHGREPVGAIVGIFVHGATLGVLVAIIFGILLGSVVAGGSLFLAAVVVAPLVEEPCKAMGLRFVRRHIDEPEDGLVYGIAVGLGFAATESLLYGLQELWDTDSATAISVVAGRAISSLLLHAGTSALLGFAYARHRLQGLPWGGVLVAYALAAGVHALYNALVLQAYWAGWAAFLAAIVMVAALMGALLRKVRELDRGAPA